MNEFQISSDFSHNRVGAMLSIRRMVNVIRANDSYLSPGFVFVLTN